MPLSTKVPSRFIDKTLGGFDPSRSPTSQVAFSAALDVAAGRLLNLVLVGPTGAGKTHLAAGIAAATTYAQQEAYRAAVNAMSEGDRQPTIPHHPLWANVADLIVGLRLDMDRPLDDRDATYLVARLRDHPSLVVLDDLGREKATDWTGEVIYTLVNHRYENRLPTVVTSNLTATELGASPYWPVISRLAEDGRLIDMGGTPDYRLKG
jgi:DNA replication protein DnaC